MVVDLRFASLCVAIFCVYWAFPSFRGFLKFPLVHVVVFLIAKTIGFIFGLKQAPSYTIKQFFSTFHVGGHRGAPTVAPENTMESFEKAFVSKVDLVEFDLSLSSDGVIVLMHDDDIMRTCGEPGLISSFTAAELATKNAGSNFKLNGVASSSCRIPTLEEVLDYCHSRNLKMLLDVKDGSLTMVSQITSLISNKNLYEEVIVSSFYPWVSYAVKKADPKILTGITWRQHFCSFSDLEGKCPRFSGIKQVVAKVLDFINVKCLLSFLPWFLGVEMFLTNEKDIDGTLVADMKKKGIEVVAWTVNDPRQMLYFIDYLKIPILTDVPHVFQEVQKARTSIQNTVS